MNNLLVAVDFSKSTDAVLNEAIKLATALKAKIWIVHITADEMQAMAFETTQFTGYAPETITMPGDIQLSRDVSAEEIKREHRELLGISSRLREQGLDTQAMLLKGIPANLILEKAQELKADMIILGSHGHGLFHKALLGSVSESVIRHAHCNVMVVPSSRE
jgi:nucleotide-binding universal stress UspA family protein